VQPDLFSLSNRLTGYGLMMTTTVSSTNTTITQSEVSSTLTSTSQINTNSIATTNHTYQSHALGLDSTYTVTSSLNGSVYGQASNFNQAYGSNQSFAFNPLINHPMSSSMFNAPRMSYQSSLPSSIGISQQPNISNSSPYMNLPNDNGSHLLNQSTNQNFLNQSSMYGNSQGLNAVVGDRLGMNYIRNLISQRERVPPTRIRFQEKDKLNQGNFDEWYDLIMADLRYFKLNSLVEREFDLEAKSSYEFKELDDITKDQIKINVCPEFKRQITHLPTAKQMFQAVKELATGSGINKSVLLTMKLKSVLDNSSSSLSDYVSSMQSVIKDFTSVYCSIPDDFWLGMIIGYLPNKYNYIRSNLSMRSDLTLVSLFATLLQEAQYQQTTNTKLLANCHLKVDSKGKQNQTKSNNQKSSSSSTSNKKPWCPYHKSTSHSKENCNKLKNANSQQSNNNNQIVNRPANQTAASTNAHSQSSNLGVTLGSLRIHQACIITSNHLQLNSINNIDNNSSTMLSSISNCISKSKWYADSGASRHMVNNRNSCVSFQHIESLAAQVANGQALDTKGIGDFVYKTVNGLIRFQDVVYSPELEASFMSVGCLDRRGYSILFAQSKCSVFNTDGELIINGQLTEENLYELNLEETQKVRIFNLLVQKPDLRDVLHWHKVLGHVNFKDLMKLKDDLSLKSCNVDGLKCEECLLAKAPRLPFKSKNIRDSTQLLEIIHSDLSGIIRISNQNRYNYYVTFTDDSTRYTITYLLNTKDQALSAFNKYKAYVELHTKFKVKFFRTDGGLEYMNAQFADQLEAAGIKKHTTCPYSAQQNGISERINRTLGEMVRAMLISSGLPESLWPYAVLYATEIKNRLPHASIDYSIPYEKFFDKKVDYSTMHQFGEKVVFVGVGGHSKKFTSSNDYGYFVGLPAGTKGYYVFVPSTGKVIISHDVYFLNKFDKNTNSNQLNESTELFDYELENVTINQSTPTSSSNQLSIDQALNSEDDFVYCPLSTSLNTDEQESNNQQESNVSSVQSINIDTSDVPEENEIEGEEMPVGEIYLTNREKIAFQRRFPHASLEFIAPTHNGKRNPPCRYLVNSLVIPKSIEQARSSNESSKWIEAANVEYLSHIQNGTWRLVKRAPEMNVLPCFWLFNTKTDEYGIINRYKARLVCLGNRQQVNPNEAFRNSSPVINSVSVKLLLALATIFGYKVRHLDVKTAFVHSYLKEPVYMKQAPGYEINGQELVYELVKSIYGLRESAANWYELLRSLLFDLGFKNSLSDNCIFISKELIIGIYVDDLIVLYKVDALIERLLEKLSAKIEVVDKGEISKCLSINIAYDHENGVMKLNQSDYINQMLNDFDLVNCKEKATPMPAGFKLDESSPSFSDINWYQRVVGSLMYLSNSTRLDISYAVNVLSRHLTKPTDQLVQLARRVLRYLSGTKDIHLHYNRSKEVQLEIFADADFGNVLHQDKSMSGIVSRLGDCTINWICKRQKTISTSTCEAEVNSILEAVNEAEFLRNLITEIGYSNLVKEPTVIYNDNQSANISSITGGRFQTNRHYRMRLGRIKESIENKLVQIKFIRGEEMKADLLTKSFSEHRLKELRELVNLIS